jgi:malate dehydrogenase (oxaloacetate-decarboxylating)(NADP+)
MFYRLCLEHMAEITPLIYTPTVGDACVQYSHIYRRAEGMVSTRLLLSSLLQQRAKTILQFISIRDKGKIGKILRNWPRIDEARIAVVTDGKAHRMFALSLLSSQ